MLVPDYFPVYFVYIFAFFQLTQAQTGKFNVHVHVEYEWRLQNEDLDESEDEMEDKVSWCCVKQLTDVGRWWFVDTCLVSRSPSLTAARSVRSAASCRAAAQCSPTWRRWPGTPRAWCGTDSGLRCPVWWSAMRPTAPCWTSTCRHRDQRHRCRPERLTEVRGCDVSSTLVFSPAVRQSPSVQSDRLKWLLFNLKCIFRLWVLGAGLLFEAASCFTVYLPLKSKSEDENMFVCDPVVSGPGKPGGIETVGRQRSSSDPHNPLTPERNSSVYGERHFLSLPVTSCHFLSLPATSCQLHPD